MSTRPSSRKTRAGEANTQRILDAALEVFAAYGFQGARIDQIATAAGLSKPNLLYYFRTKEDLYTAVLRRTLDMWLEPLQELDSLSDPRVALSAYITRKLDYSRSHPTASRLFAMEVLQGAPHIEDELKGPLKELVDEKAEVIRAWARSGKIAKCDPYHLIFSIWSTTQHYADFDVQVRAVLGQDYAGEGRFEDAARFLEQLFIDGLRARNA